MENKEILTNEEIIEATEELTVDSRNGFKVFAGIGLAALVGFGAYKLGKRIYGKIKAKKEATDGYEVEVDTFDEDSEDID